MKKAGSLFMPLLLTGGLLLLAAVAAIAQPQAAFKADTVQGCAPLVVHFTDMSAGAPTSWLWDLGNGNTSTQQNPAATYLSPGTYTVQLTATNSGGSNVVTQTNLITVFATPTINFDASQTTGCFPLPVSFTDQATTPNGSIVSWLWDFGDGQVDSVANPGHTYMAQGSYNVSLQATNSDGCTSTLTKPVYIQINSGVIADFNFTTPNSCRPPAAVSFNNASTGLGTLSYTWDFGDGQTSAATNPTHSYTAAGNYTVTLTVRNSSGCTDVIVKQQAIVLGTVSAGFTAGSPVCMGAGIPFTNTSGPMPAGARWDFGDGSFSNQLNPVKVFGSAGMFPVKLVSDFGTCKDSITLPVTVLQKPQSDFSAVNTTGCKTPLTVTFTSNAVNAVSYRWLFGDGQTSTSPNPVITYNQFGSFDVTLIVTNAAGCTDTLVKPRFVQIARPRVTITNTPQEGCVPYSFSPLFTVLTGDIITSYTWDFGDGNTATGPSPTNIYITPGTYTVKLVYTTAGGCIDSTVVPMAIRVGTPAVPAFNATPRIACAYQAIQFTDQSTGTIDRWLWQFGDGTSSGAQNPAHRYGDTGWFTVTLTVYNNGCPATLVMPNFVYIKPPIARFIDSMDCATPFTRWFRDRSIGALSWSWDFGDGNTSILQDPMHVYAAVGTYNVTLTVRNDTCEHTTQQTVRITNETADFAALNTVVCRNTAQTFTALNTTPANITRYRWDFGDGNIINGGSTISYTYRQSGQFDVTLTITDVNNCTSSLLKPLYIQANGPVAGFTVPATGICAFTPVVFTDASVPDGSNPIVQWRWKYGDGTSDTLTAPPYEHTYNRAGQYNVTLVVTDGMGCTDSITKPRSVLISKPSPLFSTPDTLSCVNGPVHFVNQTASNTPTSYTWDFGDGQTSSALNPIHNYTIEGTFTIKLTATDRYGCIDSISAGQYIGIFNPRSAFAISDSEATCPPLVVNFTNQSDHYTSYMWDFGDGTRTALSNPRHFYSFPGTYQAQLTVTSPGGCTDVSYHQLVIRGPQGSFTYDNPISCSPDTVHFTGTTKDIASFTWDFGDGTVVATGDSILTHIYIRIGNYLPKMILTDPGGCRVPYPGPDTIQVYGVNANFGATPPVLCDSGLVRFTDSSKANEPVISYEWDFGDGGGSALQNPTHEYPVSGLYPIQLIVKTSLGCVDTARLPEPIKIVRSPQLDITGDLGKCAPALLQFAATILVPDTSALQWKWDFGNGAPASQLQNPAAVNYPVPGDYLVTMTGTNSTGCVDTVLRTVHSYPMPVVKARQDATICRNSTATLQASGADQYDWKPETDLSCISCATTLAAPTVNTTYYLYGQTQYGCAGSDSVRIKVKQPFRIQTGPADTICVGNFRQLSASGAELYQWTPNYGLSNDAVSNPVATPVTSQVYRVVGWDSSHCFSDTAYIPFVVYSYPSVDLGQDIHVSAGDSVVLKPNLSSDVVAIKWQPSAGLDCNTCFNPLAKPLQNTTYRAEVINQGGCIARDNIALFVFCNNANIFMPNTFSPNGDGQNDYFYPRGRGLYTIKNFRLFNRWGEMIFERLAFHANDASTGWDGTHKGKPAPSDVYVYTIEVICTTGQTMLYSGNVMLLR